MAVYFFEVGLLLLVIPWSTFWERNTLLEAVSGLHAATRNPYLRGAVSGLGLLNLAAGLAELWNALVTWRRERLGLAASTRAAGGRP